MRAKHGGVATLSWCLLWPEARADVAAQRAKELPVRCVANIVHGFAAMHHHPGDEVLAACAAQAAQRIKHANPLDLANILWGFARLNFHPGYELLQACERACVRTAADFIPRNTVSVALALRTPLLAYAGKSAMALL